MSNRVVITGIGIVAPGGTGKEAFWNVLREGRSCVGPITRFDTQHHKVTIAAEIQDFYPHRYDLADWAYTSDRVGLYALVAAKLALADSGLRLDKDSAGDMAVIMGTSSGGLEFAGHGYCREITESDGTNGHESFNIVGSLPSSIAHNVSRMLGVSGPCILVSTGCASGADAIGSGFEYVRYGQASVVFAGASEAPIEPLTVYAFDAIGALSRHNLQPEKASRPFDLKRDGFVIGEGSGLLVLEELQHALNRGAHIYGEVIGYETTCDAYHMTGSLPDHRESVRGIQLALARAGILPEEVDYISAHGTSTPMNDKSETEIIKQVFGPHAYKMAVSSIKSMIGHLSGAAGSVQAVSCALILEHQTLPPTINYEWPDPACDLDYVPNLARPSEVNIILQNTFGFSGKNSALLYHRFY